MRFLLDTHVALWALFGVERLTTAGRDMIADASNDIFVSTASIWEIAIKRSLGRRSSPPISASDASIAFVSAGFTVIDVTAADAAAVEALPWIHSDPFDRLLVAQAATRPFRLLTHDKALSAYGSMVTCFG